MNSPDLLQMSDTVPEKKRVVVRVGGMTCGSCTKTVSGALNALPGIITVDVQLPDTAAVEYDAGILDVRDIEEAVEECGFDVLREAQDKMSAEKPTKHVIDIGGMTCQSCVQTVTKALQSLEGVSFVNVDLSKEQAVVESTGTVGHLIEAIEDCGFEAGVKSEKQGDKKLVVSTAMGRVAGIKSAVPNSSTIASPAAGNIKSVTLTIQGMTCAACVSTIEKHLRAQPGIVSCKVALLAERGYVQFKERDLTPESVREMVDDVGFEAQIIQDEEVGTVDLKIFGMTCASCSGKIERELSKVDGVKSVAVNLLGQSGKVTYDASALGVRDIIEKIEQLGFTAFLAEVGSNAQIESLERTREIQEWRHAFWSAFQFALPVSIISMICPMLPLIRDIMRWQPIGGLFLDDLLMLFLSIPVQFGIGKRFYVSAYKAYSHGSYTMDVLITLGTTIAFVFSVAMMIYSVCVRGTTHVQVFFETSTTLITFITLGRYLENLAKGKTSGALSRLMRLVPSEAVLLEADPASPGGHVTYQERNIPTEYIQAGDLLKVFPGERVPTDGVVEFGSTQIDESLVTGEPVPVSKKVGDSVIGGTVNTSGVVHVRAVRVGADTALSQIIKLVEEAQMSKAPIQDIADKVAGMFVPFVVGLGAVTFLIWLIVGYAGYSPPGFHGESPLFVALSMAIAVIVVACPCALGLATPTAVMVGTGVGAKLGILIKGGDALEVATRVTKVVFDKTGTLTRGKLGVAGVLVSGVEWSEEEVLSLIGAAENGSEHPLGRAVVKYVKERGLEKAMGDWAAEDFEAVSGKGVKCTLQSVRTKQTVHCAIGNYGFVKSLGGPETMPNLFNNFRNHHENSGHTVIYIAFLTAAQGPFTLISSLALADELKPEAPAVIRALHSMGISTTLLTGDQPATANHIGQQCHIPPSEIHAGISPSGKKTFIQRFQKQNHVVAMCGDGLNDSASIAQSDMGICVFGGTDVVVEAARVVLMRDDLRDVVTAIDLGRHIFRRIKWNFAWASGYNLIMIPLAMGLGAPWGIIMPAMVAGMAMSFSSVSVVVSSLGLKFYRPPKRLFVQPEDEFDETFALQSSLSSSFSDSDLEIGPLASLTSPMTPRTPLGLAVEYTAVGKKRKSWKGPEWVRTVVGISKSVWGKEKEPRSDGKYFQIGEEEA
ncbi:hypothetical protein HDU85_004144 [Gaertneriomyces sp. JEL0708]|nr:hypothetical protein HDU85_004144 [Gaertneriomyces sp. JEL0708]